MNDKLKEKLECLPVNPGIYQFKNDKGKIIYIGKAKNLKNRVRSYFHSSITSPKTITLVKKISDIEIIITDSEIEALVLESNLVKEHKPRYNINLKDDKSFPFIKVTNEMFPRIYPTRRIIRDGSKYFGPYTDVKSMKSALRMINQIFRIRSCKLDITNENIEKKKFKVCLDYHIKKCDGPCEGLITVNEYFEMVNQVTKMLKGKTDELIHELTDKMNFFSASLEFEKAADLRDRISRLSVITEKQKIVSDDFEDRDIIAVAFEGKDSACTIFNIRNGRLIGKKQLKLVIESDESIDTILSAVLKQYYNEAVEIPPEIVLESEPFEIDLIKEWLQTKIERKLRIIVPKKTSKLKSLVKMCKENAILQLKEIQIQKMKKEGRVPFTLAALQRDLRLKKLPKRIECFDISNLQGSDAVASLVVFVDAKPKKSLYRKFIIKTVTGPDDFASMEEVIGRRYKKLKDNNDIFPDLIMVDGGKGQLSSAVAILNKLEIKDVSIIGLAKRLEEVFLPEQKESVLIPKTSSALKLLQQIRDEAHRFAITFHRKKRSRRIISTELTSIEGIGESTALKLLKEFGSLESVFNTGEEELAKAIGKSKARKIKLYIHSKTEERKDQQ
ncbi:MAG TPA: excinuclease ABC subunit UvrC [Ignavibacteriaceae bacterium]|nr:excinuclease ABC subunit UvrC [Ignavibacteriaceae bacterium]